MADIAQHFNDGRALLGSLYKTLGQEDPLSARLDNLMGHYRNTYEGMLDFMEKGKPIEDFQPEMLRRILGAQEK
jgi:hypothetical protein